MSKGSAAFLAGCAVRLVKGVVPDVAALAGVGLVSYGCWLAYRPAGFVVGGALLIAGGWLYSRVEG